MSVPPFSQKIDDENPTVTQHKNTSYQCSLFIYSLIELIESTTYPKNSHTRALLLFINTSIHMEQTFFKGARVYKKEA